MQIRVGTDIIEVERIKQSIENFGDKFLNKIYTKEEIAYCNKNADTKYQHFAVRFAAKEAAFKAISELVDNTLIWKNIQVSNQEHGRPQIIISGIDKEQFKKIENIDVSLSHVKDNAIATVVVLLK